MQAAKGRAKIKPCGGLALNLARSTSLQILGLQGSSAATTGVQDSGVDTEAMSTSLALPTRRPEGSETQQSAQQSFYWSLLAVCTSCSLGLCNNQRCCDSGLGPPRKGRYEPLPKAHTERARSSMLQCYTATGGLHEARVDVEAAAKISFVSIDSSFRATS